MTIGPRNVTEDGEDLRTREVQGFIVQATDPHGLWHIVGAKHPIISGKFTTVPAAEKAIQNYLNVTKSTKKNEKADKDA